MHSPCRRRGNAFACYLRRRKIASGMHALENGATAAVPFLDSCGSAASDAFRHMGGRCQTPPARTEGFITRIGLPSR